jgi:hypothetical protein
MPIPLLDYDLITVAPITANCHVWFMPAACRASRSNAIFVAYLVGGRRRKQYRRTYEAGCN